MVEARTPAGDVILTLQLVEAPNRQFFWRAITADGSVSQESCTTFASLEECAADASRAWQRAERE